MRLLSCLQSDNGNVRTDTKNHFSDIMKHKNRQNTEVEIFYDQKTYPILCIVDWVIKMIDEDSVWIFWKAILIVVSIQKQKFNL